MRIGLIGDNSLEFVEKLLHIWSESNCAVIIDWRIPLNKINDLLKEANVDFIYIDEVLIYNKSESICPSLEYVSYKKNSSAISHIPKQLMQEYKPNYSEDEALILYSSGTTGKNKGIILSYRAININADSILEYMKLTLDDSLYIMKTLSHCSTIVGELLAALKAQCGLYISSTIVSPKFTLDNIEKLKITLFCINPSLLNLYCRAEKAKQHMFVDLKAIYISGSILEKEIIDEYKCIFNNIPLLNVYGLTEAGPRVTAQTLSENNIDGSVGKPIRGVKIKIVHKENIVDNKTGVIYVKTQSMFKGYVSGKSMKVDQNGWIDTGDIGYLDDDNNLFIVGRYDNMMLISAHNIFPEEVEKIIKQSNLVDDCIVYSIEDSIQGEKILCNYISNEIVDIQLRDYCSKYLAPYEIPKEFIKTDKIEYTYNGKKSRTLYGN